MSVHSARVAFTAAKNQCNSDSAEYHMANGLVHLTNAVEEIERKLVRLENDIRALRR